jgi:hypothetical protein
MAAPIKRGSEIQSVSYTIVKALILLAVTLVLFSSCGTSDKKAGKDKKDASDKKKGDRKSEAAPGTTAFEGGTFEASGIVNVPGTDQVLIIDDGKPGEVLWMKVDSAGQQSGEIKRLPLGVEIQNPEAITFDGTHYWIAGSISRPGSDDKAGLVRFTFDGANQTISSSAISGLRKFLVEQVPELKKDGARSSAEDGLNVEGITWDPNANRALLGLRSPLAGEDALLVPIALRDPKGPFTLENLTLAQPNAIRVAIGGFGVRDLVYDVESKAFWIIAGATETQKKTDFVLWKWNGSAPPERVETITEDMKPEGITRLKIEGKSFLFVVGDASSYLKLDM